MTERWGAIPGWSDAQGLFQMVEGTFGKINHQLQVDEKRRNLKGQAISAIARGDHKAHRKALDGLHLLDLTENR